MVKSGGGESQTRRPAAPCFGHVIAFGDDYRLVIRPHLSRVTVVRVRLPHRQARGRYNVLDSKDLNRPIPPLWGKGRGWGASASAAFVERPHPNPFPEGEGLMLTNIMLSCPRPSHARCVGTCRRHRGPRQAHPAAILGPSLGLRPSADLAGSEFQGAVSRRVRNNGPGQNARGWNRLSAMSGNWQRRKPPGLVCAN